MNGFQVKAEMDRNLFLAQTLLDQRPYDFGVEVDLVDAARFVKLHSRGHSLHYAVLQDNQRNIIQIEPLLIAHCVTVEAVHYDESLLLVVPYCHNRRTKAVIQNGLP